MKKTLSFLLCVLLSVCSWGQHANSIADSIYSTAYLHRDTLQISLCTSNPKAQMSFLMQGMSINIMDSTQNNIISVALPNAGMVRNQLKHHPNEVKAMHKREGSEVRPDLFPLVSALNKVSAQMIGGDSIIGQCRHFIELDKEKGCLCFSVYIPTHRFIIPCDSLLLDITSSLKTSYHRVEFDGLHLSRENRMPPNGLGNAPTETNAREREIRMTKGVILLSDDYEQIHNK